MSFFAPDAVHSVLAEHKLKSEDEFILTLVENGKKGSSKLHVSIMGKEATSEPKPNSPKEVTIQSMRDAADILAAVPDLGFRAENYRAIESSLLICEDVDRSARIHESQQWLLIVPIGRCTKDESQSILEGGLIPFSSFRAITSQYRHRYIFTCFTGDKTTQYSIYSS